MAQAHVFGVAHPALVLAEALEPPLERLHHEQERVPVLLALAAVALGDEVVGLHPEAVGGPDLTRIDGDARRTSPHAGIVRRKPMRIGKTRPLPTYEPTCQGTSCHLNDRDAP